MTPSPPCRADGPPAPLPVPADRPSGSSPRSLGAWLALNLLVLVVYSVLGVVIVLFGIGPAKISPIYPPSGIAFAATAILGWRVLPAVFLGQFLNGFPLLQVPGTTLSMYTLANIGTGIGGILEASLAAVALWRVAGTSYPFERPRQVVIFLLASALGPAIVGGTIGTLSMWACGFVPAKEFWATLAFFIFSDASGIAVFGALVLAWHREPARCRRNGRSRASAQRAAASCLSAPTCQGCHARWAACDRADRGLRARRQGLIAGARTIRIQDKCCHAHIRLFAEATGIVRRHRAF